MQVTLANPEISWNASVGKRQQRLLEVEVQGSHSCFVLVHCGLSRVLTR